MTDDDRDRDGSDSPREFSKKPLLIKLAVHDERESVDPLDARTRAGGDHRFAAIDRAPGAAAVFEPAGFSGRQRRRHDHDFSRRTGVHGGQMAAHPLVDPPAKGEHGHGGENRKYQPLQPIGGVQPRQDP